MRTTHLVFGQLHLLPLPQLSALLNRTSKTAKATHALLGSTGHSANTSPFLIKPYAVILPQSPSPSPQHIATANPASSSSAENRFPPPAPPDGEEEKDKVCEGSSTSCEMEYSRSVQSVVRMKREEEEVPRGCQSA